MANGVKTKKETRADRVWDWNYQVTQLKAEFQTILQQVNQAWIGPNAPAHHALWMCDHLRKLDVIHRQIKTIQALLRDLT